MLLTFGLCLGAGLLVKRELQRQAALSLLEELGVTCMAWHGPWGREHILDAQDWDEVRSRPFLYPEVIVVPELLSGLTTDTENPEDTGDEALQLPRLTMGYIEDKQEAADELPQPQKIEPLKLLAALEVLQPKMLIMKWTHTQGPAFWHQLSQVTSLKGLMVRAGSHEFDDRTLQEIAQLPHLSALIFTGTGITDAGLICLESCPQLKTLSLRGSRVTPQGALACLRRCPNLQIKLNGEGVSRR